MKILHKKIAYILLIILLMVASAFLLWQLGTPRGKNVVLIVSDSLRKDILSCYAGEANTPNIDWLAKNGVLFENAYVTSPWTTPSAVGMFTGHYSTSYKSKRIRLFELAIPLVFDDEILPAELLRQIGYDVKMDVETTAVIGQNTMQGFEKIKTYDELTDGEKSHVQRITGIKDEEDSYKQMYGFLDYLLTKAEDRFFVLKWILDPHSPYNPPAKFKQEIQIDLSQLPRRPNFYSNLLFIGGNYSNIEQRYLKALYTKEVESVDERLGYILKALEHGDMLDDTYIVFTSDHGESFGEHGAWCHGQNYYEEQIAIPLIIVGPGIPKGKRVNTIVSLLSMMETLQDLLGVKFQYKSQGKSFKNLLSRNPLKHILFSITHSNSAYFVGANEASTQKDALRENHYKLICRKDNTYELYNLLDDPHEANNLAKQCPDVVEKMSGNLQELREKNNIIRESRTKVDDSVQINTEFIEQLKALGYLGSHEEEVEQAIWLEAEHADSIVSPFEIAADEDASNGRFIYVPDGTGNEYTPGSTIMATYTINILEPEVYFLWGRIKAPHEQANSFFIQMDNKPDNLWEVYIGDSWRWYQANHRGTVDPIGFKLTKGIHTLRIKLREDGTKLDKLLLTNDAGFVPSGKGVIVSFGEETPRL